MALIALGLLVPTFAPFLWTLSGRTRRRRWSRRITKLALAQVDELFTKAESRMWLVKMTDRRDWEA